MVGRRADAASIADMTEAAEIGSPRRKRVPRAQREQQILAVAEEVFAERGFQATSMDEVSLRVGVSKPMLYEYFNSKEGLLLACVARIRADLQEATVQAVASAQDDGPRKVLEAGLEAYFDFADRHGRAWAVLLNESVIVAGPAEEAIEAIRGQQTELMESLLAGWLTEAPPVRIAVFAHALIGASERVARWRLRDGSDAGVGAGSGAGVPLSPRETAVMLADVFWPGFEDVAKGSPPTPRDGA
jgi:AcrR family transcriptional regulator